jgi:hypothetical protein
MIRGCAEGAAPHAPGGMRLGEKALNRAFRSTMSK